MRTGRLNEFYPGEIGSKLLPYITHYTRVRIMHVQRRSLEGVQKICTYTMNEIEFQQRFTLNLR